MLMSPPSRSIVETVSELPLSGASNTEALVLAGAHTWRATPFDTLLPRPLLPVAQLPLIGYPLLWVRRWGAARVTVCANGWSTAIRQHLARHRRTLPTLTFHEDHGPRGAAGCARDAALGSIGDTFVVVDGTTIPHVNLARIIDEHRATRAALTIVVQPVPRGNTQSVSPLVPTGIYVFSRRAMEAVPAAGYQDIKESLIPRLYAAGDLVTTTEAEGTCPRVLDAQTYLSVNQWMIARTAVRADTDHEIDPVGRGAAAVIHPRALVSPSALLVGPVLVDAGAEIGPNATIVGPTSIGARSKIGASALVSRSIVWSRTVIGEGAIVDRSVLADHVHVANGARIVGAVKAGRRSAAPEHEPSETPLPELQPVAGLAFN
jgi:NDP-sugar pyrophosphorylase family protein